MLPARVALVAAVCLAAACSRSTPEPPAKAENAGLRPSTAAVTAAPSAPALASARVGEPAPDFELPDLDGKLLKLSSFRA